MILDVNCFIGHWPFRRIPYRTVGDIVQLMARTDTHGALMTPLAGLFYKERDYTNTDAAVLWGGNDQATG